MSQFWNRRKGQLVELTTHCWTLTLMIKWLKLVQQVPKSIKLQTISINCVQQSSKVELRLDLELSNAEKVQELELVKVSVVFGTDKSLNITNCAIHISLSAAGKILIEHFWTIHISLKIHCVQNITVLQPSRWYTLTYVTHCVAPAPASLCLHTVSRILQAGHIQRREYLERARVHTSATSLRSPSPKR